VLDHAISHPSRQSICLRIYSNSGPVKHAGQRANRRAGCAGSVA
jgi:hypothetical protein